MRVTNGPVTRRRRKAIKRKVEGAGGTKHTSYKIARQTLIRASKYALRDRRVKKRDFRSLGISRITAALKPLGHNYSSFINQLNKKQIKINRKIISELAINNQPEFLVLVNKAFN